MRIFPRESERLEVKYVTAIFIFVVMAISFLPSTQSYNLHHTPYNSEVLQIEPSLALPYMNDHKRDTPTEFQQEIDFPAALLTFLENAEDEYPTDYARDYSNLRQDISAHKENYDDTTLMRGADSRKQVVDFPTGTPESVS